MKYFFTLSAALILMIEIAVCQVTVINDTLYIGENDTVSVDLLKNDTGVNLTISSLNLQGTLGGVNINEGDTLISYGALKGYNGTDGFLYTTINSSGDSAVGEVLVNILPGLSADYYTVSLYKFENDTSNQTFDFSYNNHNAISIGTQQSAGLLGYARYFNGIDDYINMDTVRKALNSSIEWTLEYVAKAVSDTIIPPAIINHACGNGWLISPQRGGISYGIKTNSAGACFWNGGGWQYGQSEPLDTSWHYYVLTYKNGDSLRVYRDGKQITAQIVSGIFNPTQGNSFKATIGLNDFSGGFQEGYIDEVRVSSIARTSAEISHTFNLINHHLGLPTNIPEEEKVTPDGFQLLQNYPNPFNPTTTIQYSIPQSGHVSLKVYDVLGNEVAALINEEKDKGVYLVTFNALGLASGIYFYRIQAGSFTETKQMILIK